MMAMDHRYKYTIEKKIYKKITQKMMLTNYVKYVKI